MASTQAADANNSAIYNETVGKLPYDTDGSVAAATTQIVTLGIGLLNPMLIL